MKKALVTLDLKKDSRKLIQKAIDWGKAFGGEIVLLHVELIDVDNKSLRVDSGSDSQLNLLRSQNLEKIQTIESELTSHEISFKKIVKSGEPEDVILETASAENVDLIFIGLNKHSSAYKFLIGSVADLVVKKTEIPVLLIPND